MHFNEKSESWFTPRGIILDHDPSTFESVLDSDLCEFYDHNLNASGLGSTNGNYGKGRYTDVDKVKVQFKDMLRKEAECWDTLHGVQIIHSLGGGTGSGLGYAAIQEMREEYPDKIWLTYSVFPSCTAIDNTFELYNTVFSMMGMIEMWDQVMCIDNESLYETCFKFYDNQWPTFDDFNTIIADTATDISSVLRFPNNNNADWRKISTKLTCFPRLHFFAAT